MSINNGSSWTLYPDTTFGAVVEGGDLPHVDVTDLSLSQGNVAVATGMPNLAGPYNPEDPTPTYAITGIVTNGSELVTGISSTTDLAQGQGITGLGIPSGTTIEAVDGPTSITLSSAATLTNTVNLTVNPADPDLLLATTYGEGAFAINLAPMLFPTSVQIAAASGTSTDVTTDTPTIDGESEISGFGNATWVSIVDETPGDSTYGQIIGGFNPALITPSMKSITANSTNSTDAFGNFAITVNAGAFTSDGTKTIEIYTTDDAGAKSNPVTLTFTLDVPGLAPPSVPITPTLQLVTSTPGYTNSPTPELIGVTSPNATVDLYQVGSPSTVLATATANNLGSFTVTFPDMTMGDTGTFGPYTVYVTAMNSMGTSSPSNQVNFTIIIGTPAAPGNFALASYSDTGIVGDDITSDRTPYFVGTTLPGATVNLYEVVPTGSTSPIYATVIANSSGNFAIQLPFSLNNGSISLYVEATDKAGNLSLPSNTLTVMIVSVASDYNGDGYSDAALYSRSTNTFTATLTSGSSLVSGMSSLTGLVAGVAITGTAVPSGTTIQSVNTSGFTGILLSGSALVTGISSTTGLFAGENVTGTGIPAGATIQTVNSSTAITLSAAATAQGTQNLTATTLTLSASATASGSQSLTASFGEWLVKNTSVGPANPAAFWIAYGTAFGPSNVTPFQGDFDGDGLTDLAYYQSSTATWYMDDSKSNTMTSFVLGTPNVSIPVVGYFNANGPEEAAVYTNGVWTFANGSPSVSFGGVGDIPVPGDYTGIGYDELAVYRPSTGQFFVQVPGGNNEAISIPGIGGGTPDVPVPGNYNPYPNTTPPPPYIEDTEPAVFDPNTGVYTILGPNNTVQTVTFAPGDIPAPADYLGNGSTQPAVFRPSNGNFYEMIGGTQTVIASFGAGASADIPLASPLQYRMPADPPADPPSTGTGNGGAGASTGTSTGSGTTNTGSGTTSTGSGSTNTGSGSSSVGQGSSTTSTTPTSSSSGSSTSSSSLPGTSSHKTKVSKSKKAVHPKKAKTHAEPKKAQHPAAKPKVHVVSHPAKKAIKVVTAHAALAKKPTHVVDLALEGVHVNLRRSSSGKKD